MLFEMEPLFPHQKVEFDKSSRKYAKDDDKDAAAYGRGQLAELQWIRKYLQENIDLKNFVYY